MDSLKRRMKEHKSLPPEIIELILRSLPAKSLGRFKSVSKTWNSLISDPLFIKTHVHRHQTKKCILVSALGSLYSIATNEFDSLDTIATAKELIFGSPPIQWKMILGSCNGLVLAQDQNDIIFIMNPTTRELWKLPTSPFARADKKFYVKYGFCYDSSTDDYKVISIRFRRYIFQRSVYSLRKNSWRKLPSSPNNDDTYISLVDGAVVNHNYHWLATSSTILTFSFVDEVFSEIKRPEIECLAGCEEVIEIGGKLGMFLGDDDALELWEMQEYGNGNSWTRVCSHKFLRPVGQMCMIKGKERDLVFEDEDNELVVFTIDEGARRNVRIVGGPSEFTKFTVQGAYVESIESPNRVVTPT